MKRRSFLGLLLAACSVPAASSAAAPLPSGDGTREAVLKALARQERALRARGVRRVTSAADGRPIEAGYLLMIHPDDEHVIREWGQFVPVFQYGTRGIFSEAEIGSLRDRGYRVVVDARYGRATLVGAGEYEGAA